MKDCFACDVNTGRRTPPGGPIIDDELWVADHGIPPLARGYVVLKPRRHVESLADLTAPEAAALGSTAQRLMAAMRTVLGPERIYLCSMGESVRHVHFHLVPRYVDMPPAGPGLLSEVFAERWRVSEDEAAAVAAQIRTALDTD